jgi:DNA-binding response OmpR family regulator
MSSDSPQTATSNRTRILIVDDDPAIRDILGAVLRREGLNTDAAADGEQAIAMLGSTQYGAVLLDLMMPRVDGVGVLAFMKERGLNTPVIVLSAVTSELAQTLDPQIVRIAMQKPFEIGELKTVIAAIVEKTGR